MPRGFRSNVAASNERRNTGVKNFAKHEILMGQEGLTYYPLLPQPPSLSPNYPESP